jgi:hypothetical protein
MFDIAGQYSHVDPTTIITPVLYPKRGPHTTTCSTASLWLHNIKATRRIQYTTIHAHRFKLQAGHVANKRTQSNPIQSNPTTSQPPAPKHKPKQGALGRRVLISGSGAQSRVEWSGVERKAHIHHQLMFACACTCTWCGSLPVTCR